MEAMPQNWNDDRLDDLSVKVDRGFEHVDRRFEQVDQRFEHVDRRFEQVDQRFEQVDERLAQIDKRFEAVDRRLEKLDERLHEDSVAVRVEIRDSAENTQRMLIQAMLVILTLTMGGFSGLIVLIATRL
jgi:predicted  nucleic acid-binding Zn-ribbon protein